MGRNDGKCQSLRLHQRRAAPTNKRPLPTAASIRVAFLNCSSISANGAIFGQDQLSREETRGNAVRGMIPLGGWFPDRWEASVDSGSTTSRFRFALSIVIVVGKPQNVSVHSPGDALLLGCSVFGSLVVL